MLTDISISSNIVFTKLIHPNAKTLLKNKLSNHSALKGQNNELSADKTNQ